MSKQVNYFVDSPNGRFGFSTNIHLRKMDYTLNFTGLGIARVVSGSGTWQIGSELCRIKESDILFLSNLDPRRVTSASDDLFLETFNFNIATLPSAGVGDCLRVYYGRKKGFTHAINAPELYPYYNTVREEFLSGAPAYSLLLACAIEILIGAGRYYDRVYPGTLETNFRCDSTSVGTIAESVAYINDHLTEELRVEELAKLAGMSGGHYTRTFRKYVQLTPVDYIARCRVKRFLSLMGEGGKNILDVAFACGFNSASGFYKTFRRICGHSPSEATSLTYNGKHIKI